MRVKLNWQLLDLTNIPEASGVYAFKDDERWLYIGKAVKLKRRLTQRHIPLQIALECFPNASFYYILSESPLRLEKQLHERLKPEWNRGTARVGSKFPLCKIPDFFEVSLEQRKAASSVIGF